MKSIKNKEYKNYRQGVKNKYYITIIIIKGILFLISYIIIINAFIYFFLLIYRIFDYYYSYIVLVFHSLSIIFIFFIFYRKNYRQGVKNKYYITIIIIKDSIN
jgi:hypothetical protein